MSTPPHILGLIAGEGEFPILVARGAKERGLKVVCASLGGFARPELAELVDANASVGLMRLGQWIRVLRPHGQTQTIIARRVPKNTLYPRARIGPWSQLGPPRHPTSPYRHPLRHDNRDHNLLQALADELK